jgi:Raf kinase inhibitor-like YbhB/YbcL family protein
MWLDNVVNDKGVPGMRLTKYILSCILFVFTSNAVAVDFNLPHKEWRLISLPADPPAAKNTVEKVFGDDISGVYGTDWALYEYNSSINQYHELNKTDPVKQGIGYWIIQLSGNDVTLDLPAGSHASAPSIALTSSKNQNPQWNLVGSPFSDARSLDSFSVKVANSDMCGDSGCSLDEAKNKQLVHNKVWTYNGQGYEGKGTGDTINPWDGFWIATLPGASGYDLSLVAAPTSNYISSISASDNGVMLNLKMTGNFIEGSHFGFYIDADNNPSTGYKGGVNEIVGADYLVESGGLHQYPDGAHGWKWKRVSTDSIMENSSTEVQAHIPLRLLNVVGHTIKYLGSVASSDWSRNTYSQMTEYQLGLNPPDTPIVIIGPSTVYIASELNGAMHLGGSDCRLEGWGERLYQYATHPDAIYNYAQPGSNATSFLEPPESKNRITQMLFGPNRDHYWAKTKEKMQRLKEGILLIQYGANEKSGNEEKFKNSIKLYIDEARALNFTPILITSIEKRLRNDDGSLKQSRGNFPRWMKEIAEDESLRVLDLNKKSYEEYSKYTNAQWDEKFSNCYAKWGNKRKEDTHYEPKGAKIVASWLRDLACENSGSKLCKQLRGTPKTFKLSSNNFISEHGSPQLSWQNVPKDTKSFALIIDDQDAKDDGQRDWIHWSVMNINKNVTSIAANTRPDGALIELNSNGSRSYADPAFPKSHTYVAHIYAMDVEDISKVEQANHGKIYYLNSRYDHKVFEKIFGNFILEKSRIDSRR